MKSYLHKILIFIFLLTCFTLAQKKPFTIDDLYKVKNVDNPVLSSSENKIAFTVTDYNLNEGKSSAGIFIIDNDGNEITNIGDEKKTFSKPMWSPDDNTLYFINSSQLYSYNFESKQTKQLTNWAMGISAPILSPDGNYVAFTTDIYPECGIDNECNKNTDSSAIKGPIQAYIADALLYRHWTKYNREKEYHLFIYDIKNNSYRDLAKSEWLSDEYKLGGDAKYSFSPDSKELCFISSPEKNLAASTNGDLYTISISGGTPVNITSSNKSWDGSPNYSPDGKYIAYRLQEVPDFEADRYRLAIYDRASKQSKILTEPFDYDADNLEWGSDSKTIYFTAEVEGYQPIYSVNINSLKISEVSEKLSIFNYDVSPKNNSIVYNARTVAKPGEIYKLDLASKESKQLTFFNKQLLSEVDFRSAEQMWVEGADGIKVQVFIVKPHNFDETKKYPLILNVHGGPQSQWMDSFRGDWQIYPGAGYIVAFPNPHGSKGFGQEYTNEISRDWGGKVFEDLMKVTDALEQLPYVDTARVGAMGWSFGGYMMNWFQAKTKRFKCLASMMGIFDLESMWGATEELWFVNWDLGGAPWMSDDYKKYSPSNYAKDFSTPTLIITGEKDYRVSYTQSVQYFTTLQTLGIDSRLIIFPNDGHWPNNVKSMPLYYNAHLEWFHKYLGGGNAPYDSKEMIKNLEFSKNENQ